MAEIEQSHMPHSPCSGAAPSKRTRYEVQAQTPRKKPGLFKSGFKAINEARISPENAQDVEAGTPLLAEPSERDANNTFPATKSSLRSEEIVGAEGELRNSDSVMLEHHAEEQEVNRYQHQGCWDIF